MAFVVFEGVDGVGKTTQVNLLRKYLKRHRIDYYYCYEPAGVPIGKAIVPFLEDTHPSCDLTHTLLVLAARNESIRNHIIPHQRQLTLCDRFMDSTYVYQGGPFCSLSLINTLALPVVKDLIPDVTFVLTANAPNIKKRLEERGRTDKMLSIERILNLNASYRDLVIKQIPYPNGKVPKRVLLKTDCEIEATHTEIVDTLRKYRILSPSSFS